MIKSDKPAKPFRNNDDFLTAAVEWAVGLWMTRIVERRVDFAGDPDSLSFGKLIPAGATPDSLYRQFVDRAAATVETGVTPPLMAMFSAFDLTAFEKKVVLLSLASSFGEGFQATVRRGPPHRLNQLLMEDVPGLTVGSTLKLLCDTVKQRRLARRHLQKTATLFTRGLLILEADDYKTEEEYLRLDIRLPRRMFNAILGEEGISEAAYSYAQVVDPTIELDNVILHSDVRKRVDAICQAAEDPHGHRKAWMRELPGALGSALTVLMMGPAGTGKNLLAHGIAKRLGKKLLHIDYPKFAWESRGTQGESPLTAVLREAWLQDAVPFFDECAELFTRDVDGTDFLTTIEYQTGLILFATNDWVQMDKAFERRMLYRLDIESPDASMRKHIWQMHLPPAERIADDVNVHELSLTYELNGGNIKNAILQAGQAASARNPVEPRITQEDLRLAAEQQLKFGLAGLADQIVPKVTLEKVILPQHIAGPVREIVEVARSSTGLFTEWGFEQTVTRGKGLTALFRGEPGTGKTLTAEAIAKELGRTLYKVNSAQLMSMWVGQTEKNIRELFRAVGNRPAVLLFDEADGIFGRRIETAQSSNDRFTNNITNLLLQEIEEFPGLVILTSNLAANMDQAFERRLAYRIDFPLPSERARADIWRALIPDKCPVASDVDYEELGGRFPMSGGFIKNAVLRAARLRYAAQDGELTQKDLVEAAEKEHGSAGGDRRAGVGFVVSR